MSILEVNFQKEYKERFLLICSTWLQKCNNINMCKQMLRKQPQTYETISLFTTK